MNDDEEADPGTLDDAGWLLECSLCEKLEESSNEEAEGAVAPPTEFIDRCEISLVGYSVLELLYPPLYFLLVVEDLSRRC